MRAGDKFDADHYLEYAGPVGDLARDSLRKLDPKPGEKILDVGCGDGAITLIIQKSGADVHGIDFNEDMVRVAYKKGLNVTAQSATDLQFEDGTFDKVFSNSALHWIPDRKKCFSEMGRVLKDGGLLTVEFARRSPPEITAAIIKVSRDFGVEVADKNPWHNTNTRELERWLNSAGFENIKIKPVSKLQSLSSGFRPWLENFVARTFFAHVGEPKTGEILDKVSLELQKFPNYFAISSNPECFADYQRFTVTATFNKEKALRLAKYNRANNQEERAI